MENNLYNNYGKLLSICNNEDDFSLFTKTLDIYIDINPDIDLRKMLSILLNGTKIFKYDLLNIFKDKHSDIFDKELLSYFFEPVSTYYSYTELLQQQYCNINRYEPSDLANTDENLLDYFKDEDIDSFFNQNVFSLIHIWNKKLFKKIEDKEILTDQHYLFVHKNIKDYLLENTNNTIIEKKIQSFFPEDIKEDIKDFKIKDFYTLYNKSIDEIFIENKQRDKIILESFFLKSHSGMIISNSKKANLDFLKRYPDWENELIQGQTLTEILLWSNLSYIKNFLDTSRIDNNSEKNNNLLSKNKYVKIIKNLPEKLKLMTLFPQEDVNAYDIGKIKKLINEDLDINILLSLFMTHKKSFAKNLTDNEKDLIFNIFSNMTVQDKNTLLHDSNFESILTSIHNLGLTQKIGEHFTDIEKGNIINIRTFNHFPEFFYGFKNDDFRNKNSKICKKSFEKETLFSSLKIDLKKDISL